MNWNNLIINRGSQSSNTVTDVNAIHYNQGIICHEYEVMIKWYLQYACMDDALHIHPSVQHVKLKNVNHWPDLDQLFMHFCEVGPLFYFHPHWIITVRKTKEAQWQVWKDKGVTQRTWGKQSGPILQLTIKNSNPLYLFLSLWSTD